MTKTTHRGLPFTTTMYIDSETLVAAGYDKTPYLYKKGADGWALAKTFDDGFETFKKQTAETGVASSVWKVEETKSDVTLPEGVRMYE